MRNLPAALLFASILLVGTIIAPALYAEGSQVSSGSMIGHGTMGGGHMMGMSRMMDRCGEMMQGNRGSSRPNDQWRNHGPSDDDNKN